MGKLWKTILTQLKQKLKLYYARVTPYIGCAEVLLSSLVTGLSQVNSKTVDSALSDESLFQHIFGEKTDIWFYISKMKKTIQAVNKERCKSLGFSWYQGVSMFIAWVICKFSQLPLMQS